jgi:hypothetical protein
MQEPNLVKNLAQNELEVEHFKTSLSEECLSIALSHKL